MPRITWAEIAMRPTRSRSSTAIGASSTGGRSTARPGSASLNPFTQSISGNRRITCRKASAMPKASTKMITPLRTALARKAVQICLYSTITTSAQRVRNTTIRTIKIRGEESLNGSISCAMAISAPTSTHNKARPRRKEEGGAAGRPRGGPRSTRSGRGLSDRCGLVRILERPQHFAVNVLVARENAAGLDHIVASVEIGDEAAGFAHQRDSRRHVPRRQPALPIGVEAAGRDPGEIERCGAESPQSGDPLLHRDMLAAREFHVAAAGMRERAGDSRVGEPLARRHPQPLIVEEGALAALGRKQLVIDGIVDDAGDDGAFALEPDRDRKVGNSVQKIQRAVERIDDPAVSLVAAFARAAFLAQKTVAGTRMLELVAQDFLGAPVGSGDEIGRPLERRLQMLDLAEIALERAARLARGLDHHVEEGGAEHGGPRSGGDGPAVGP